MVHLKITTSNNSRSFNNLPSPVTSHKPVILSDTMCGVCRLDIYNTPKMDYETFERRKLGFTNEK